MTYPTQTTFPDTLKDRLRDCLRALWGAIAHAAIRYGEIRSRAAQIRALEELDDAELARRGLTRHEIPRYVFRDVMTM